MTARSILRLLTRRGSRRGWQAWKPLCLASLVFLLSLTPSLGQDLYSLDVDTINRGETITIARPAPGPEAPKPSDAILRLVGASGSQTINASAIISDPNRQNFTFFIPESLPLGQYITRIAILPVGQKSAEPSSFSNIVIAGSPSKKLTIHSELGKLTPSIQSVMPRAIFPGKDGAYSFEVIGSGFSQRASENQLVLSRQRKDGSFIPIREIQICWQGSSGCKPIKRGSNQGLGEFNPNSPRLLRFSQLQLNPNEIHGDLGLQIRVGDQISMPEFPIILSHVGRFDPLILTAFVLAAVTVILIVIQKGVMSLLIDPETKTYSLSRFQFLVWSAVAILSYSFLLLSRVLSQDKLEFIDIPDGLPGIVLISSATTVFTAGISGVKGNKGSAQLKPQLSDFYCSGGYVMPERLQFFVWTILGASAYILVVILQSPAEIDGLPTIPPGFLQLSGLSSLGYLGGRLARKPGPVITSMEKAKYDASTNRLTLVLRGSNLSKDATFKLEKYPRKFIHIPQEQSAIVKVMDSAGNETALGNVLTISLDSPTNEWPQVREAAGLTTPYSLTIYNPDDQFAEWQFDGPSASTDLNPWKPIITAIHPSTVTIHQDTLITVTGSQFAPNVSQVSIKDAHQNTMEIRSLQVNSETEIVLQVTMTGTPPYQASLTVENPGLVSSDPFPFAVVAPG